jgi:hypothetical protein
MRISTVGVQVQYSRMTVQCSTVQHSTVQSSTVQISMDVIIQHHTTPVQHGR